MYRHAKVDVMLSAGLCRSLLNYHLMLCTCASDLFVNTFPCFYLMSVFVAQQLIDSRDSYCESRVALYTCRPMLLKSFMDLS